MRGYSDESPVRKQILSFVVPVIGHILSMTARKLITFVDTFAGPGRYEGEVVGSPGIFYNTARMLTVDSRVVLIEKAPKIYDQLLRFAWQLPAASHVSVLPVLGDCQNHVARMVDAAEGDPVVIFSDPCGYSIPPIFEKLAVKKNVTLLLRYSLVAANRQQQGQAQLQKALARLKMPYWGCNVGDAGGLHKYCLVLGAHNQHVASACSRALPPIPSADIAIERQLMQYMSRAPTLRVDPPKSAAKSNGSSKNGKSKRATKYIPFSAKKLATVKKLRAEGVSFVKIAKKLGVSDSTVVRRLQESGKR